MVDARKPWSVSILHVLDPEDIEDFLAIYREAFDAVVLTSPCRQSLNDAEFREEMVDESVLKLVLWGPDGRPAAMAFAGTDISKLTWLEPRYFEAKFPDAYRASRIYYIGALLVRPDLHGPYVVTILSYLADYAGARQGVVAFDCSEYRTAAGMPDLIQRIADRRVVADLEKLETQHYWAYVVHGPKPGVVSTCE